jgi:large subunit ribosomal protein L35
MGMPWRSRKLNRTRRNPPGHQRTAGFIRVPFNVKETSEMPKMKTKSGAKKRFKVTASGRIKAGPAGKRHNMIKRTQKFIRNARGFAVLDESDAGIIRQYMPYARKKRRAKAASPKKEG